MEVCAGFELIAMENATALGHDVLELSKRPEAQMIGHMRHGSPPRLLALQSILSPNRRESLPTPSAGDRITSDPMSIVTFDPLMDVTSPMLPGDKAPFASSSTHAVIVSAPRPSAKV